MKRTFDLCAALVGLMLLWPLLVVAALAIKLDSPGPILFRQIRVGRGLRPFSLLKLRTMRQDGSTTGPAITAGEDPRITRVGRVLRRWKVDELPQLLNVLVGDMSIVGPRPEVPRYVELFRTQFANVLVLRPGLTDIASLKFIDESALLGKSADPEDLYRHHILPEKLRLAELYLRHASLLFDLALVLQTLLRLLHVPVLVCEIPGAYASGEQRPSTRHHLGAFIVHHRRLLIVFFDLWLIVLANYTAFWLRFDGAIPKAAMNGMFAMLPWVVSIRALAMYVFRLNEGLWRYTSLWDFRNIVVGVGSSTLVLYLCLHSLFREVEYPGSIYVIDGILLIGLLTGTRLSSRLLREKLIHREQRKVLVIGAGDAGERIVREMKMEAALRYDPIGLVDEDQGLLHQRIHGVKVLGAVQDLPRILAEKRPQEVVLALRHPKPAQMRSIISALEPFKISIKTVPNVEDLLTEKSVVSQIRKVHIADLLPRAPVCLDVDSMRRMVTGRRILITGAGGSIGSELSRQIAALKPEQLVLFERHENSLYTIQKELCDKGFESIILPVIGDVTDVRRLSMTLHKHRPGILFHAAAHKHVPLVELNPTEALKNNCMGTRIAAELADRFEVERFVLISTDKAVNPSSIMGATKRVAELVVQRMARRSNTRFLTVRFGNVLGSNGSVLLRFQEQIEAGGPVTVTHPAIRRYFMLIPEAVHLVLQAASLGEQGAVYVLDMGEQIRVLDLARNLIRLSGFVPGEEIPIRYIGLRPGEKLFEELLGEGEVAVPSGTERILRISASNPVDFDSLEGRLATLETAGHLTNSTWMMEQLRELIPTFRTPDQAELPEDFSSVAWQEGEAVWSE